MKKIVFNLLALFILLAVCSSVFSQNIGERVSIEGYVENAGKNSLYVDGKILVANEYSSINTSGTDGIYVGDFVMVFAFLNEDMKSYTIEMLTKKPELSLGTPTPLPTETPTPPWFDLFTPTPGEESSTLKLLADEPEDENTLWDPNLFGPTTTPTPTIVPTATPSSVTFEGTVTDASGHSIFIDDVEYIADNGTSFKDPDKAPVAGDYVRGRAAPYPGTLLLRYLEIVPAYERPDADVKKVYGLYQSQDTSTINVSLPEGDITGQFYSNTKMSKTFYTKNTLVSLDMLGEYVKSVMDYPLVQTGENLEPLNGEITKIVRFSDNEIYIISNNLAYFVNQDTRFIPSVEEFKDNTPFVGLIQNGRVRLLAFTENNRVKTVKGSVSSTNSDDGLLTITVGGLDYTVNRDTVSLGDNIEKHSDIIAYADSTNTIFYLNAHTPWYASMKDWNWTIIIPAVIGSMLLLFFLLLHRTRTEGFLQEVNGNIITLTDARGENKRRFKCTNEIAALAGSLITMKVEITVYHGKVIHIRYDF
ncbi:MAG: hypothetical protein IJI14_16030 [Anaerolineaceae bacterium]|nr:hypothetical protein [Anaerolineaceae bacterium]